MEIAVTRCVIAILIDEARKVAEFECCGLLLGEDSLGGKPSRITIASPAANVHPDRARHFEIDPAVLIDAYRAERDGGPVLLGFYHSHPNGHPGPSVTDCEHAGGDGRVWAIIAANNVYFWRDTPQGFVPVSFEVVIA